MAIWGNHSATQYPDFTNAKINGQPAADEIGDRDWLEGDFIKTVQQRGAAIIKARGASSAASAANAVVDSVGSIINPTAGGDYHSVCLCSDGSYGVDEGLISSFPVRNVAGQFDIVQGVQIDAFSKGKIDATVNELKEEREMVKDLLPG
jgi:malate dehydrogenase